MGKQKISFVTIIIALLMSITQVYAKEQVAGTPIAYEHQQADYFVSPAPMNTDGLLTVIVTTPAGTTQINSADLDTGSLTAGTNLRQAVPFDFGIIARASDVEGKSVPVIILSDKPASIGYVDKGYAIGTFELVNANQDVLKGIVATTANSKYKNIFTLELLTEQFPDIKNTLTSWAEKNNATFVFTGDRFEALMFSGDRILDYAQAHITEEDRRPMDANGNPTLLNHPLSLNLRREK